MRKPRKVRKVVTVRPSAREEEVITHVLKHGSIKGRILA